MRFFDRKNAMRRTDRSNPCLPRRLLQDDNTKDDANRGHSGE
jgi:hypothetical protein